jgi:hypothetical protein
VEFLGGSLAVVPGVAEEDIAKVWQRRPAFDIAADRRECPHFFRRVPHGRTGSRPPWLCAAAGPAAAAPTAPAAPRRGVGRRRVRRRRVRLGRVPVAAVAAIAATACGAVRCGARCAMASYWCCASSHVADDTMYHRRIQARAKAPRTGALVVRHLDALTKPACFTQPSASPNGNASRPRGRSYHRLRG